MARPASPRLVEKCFKPLNNHGEENENALHGASYSTLSFRLATFTMVRDKAAYSL